MTDNTQTLTVIPAYGRDYKSAQAVKADWEAGKDFQIADIGSRYNGAYCSNRDPIRPRIRYAKLRKVVIL